MNLKRKYAYVRNLLSNSHTQSSQSTKHIEQLSMPVLKRVLLCSSTLLAINIPAAYSIPEAANQVDSTKQFQSASTCKGCHQTQYDQWSGSMMAYASLSPVIGALEKVENRRNAELAELSAPAATRITGRLAKTPNHGGTENQLACQKCHSPIGVTSDIFPDYSVYQKSSAAQELDSRQVLEKLNTEGLNAFLDRPNLSAEATTRMQNNLQASLEGVTCVACHRITGPDPAQRNGFNPGIANNAYLIEGNENTLENNIVNYGPYLPFQYNEATIFPFDELSVSEHETGFSVLRNDPFSGQLVGNTAPNSNSGYLFVGEDGLQRPYIQTGEFCGSCHDVRLANTDGVSTRNLENLFSEWRNSPWNNNDNIPNANELPDSMVKDTNSDGSIKRVLSSSLENPRENAIFTGRPGKSFINYNGNLAFPDDEVLNHLDEPVKRITTCQDCHMSKYMKDPLANPGEYDKGPIAFNSSEMIAKTDHSFIGVDKALIDLSNTVDFPNKAAQLSARDVLLQKAVDFKVVNTRLENSKLYVDLSVTNVGAGHNVPAGFSQERQVWIDMKIEDRNGTQVFRSGYLTRTPGNANGYDAYCDNPANEWKCDLDETEQNTQVASNLKITTDSGDHFIEEGAGKDTQLVNYQNQFKKGGKRIFNPFTSDEVDNSHSLAPFVENRPTYEADVDPKAGPFTITAKLRFRPFPHEFLEALADGGTNRIDESVMEGNTIIDMESDTCISGSTHRANIRACSPVKPLALGSQTSCQVHENQTVECWGRGGYGLLGDGVTNSTSYERSYPAPVFGGTITNLPAGINERVPLAGITQLALGNYHSCALKNDGTVYCWGLGVSGKLGDGNTSSHTVGIPQQINPAQLSAVTSISSGYSHSCAVFNAVNAQGDTVGNVKCWGDGLNGALGTGNENDQALPALIDTNLLPDVEMITSGSRHNCALLKSGEVMCWGQGTLGELGNGNNQNSLIPVKVVGLNYAAKYIAAGRNSTCAILANKQVKCWGNGQDGRLGDGITSSHNTATPVLVQGLTTTTAEEYERQEEMTMISLGNRHSCGLMADGTVKCWGNGINGATGNDIYDLGTPTKVEGLSDIVYLAAGGYHTCAMASSGLTYCFGEGNWGQVGDHINSNHRVLDPSPVYDNTPIAEDSENLEFEFSNTGTVPWKRYSGQTQSGSTGPSSGANGSSSYYYMETSFGYADSYGDTAILESGFIDVENLGSNAKLSFDYHMYGSGIGTLYVDIYIFGSWVTNHWSRDFNQGNQWNHEDYDLSSFAGSGLGTIKVRLRAKAVGTTTGGSSFQGDIAIDNISLITN